ncbi:hypothetical protein JW710_00335 [Candidatus Dojkabacteria bacterium]|nr:hypothetical protein [Candidatus Dojkabacteria bacterium]
MPSAGTPVYIAVNTVPVPSGSNTRGVRYIFRVDNESNSWVNCGSGPSQTYDHCGDQRAENYTINLRDRIGIVEGASYHTWAWAGTLDRCDDDIKLSGRIDGYFKINHLPRVISSSPSTGISGNEPDEEPSSSCDDHNPQTYSITYRDLDGTGHINFAALWIDDAIPHVSNVQSSVQASISRQGGGWVLNGLGLSSGVEIGVWAYAKVIGDCALPGNIPKAEILIDDVSVRTFDVDVGNSGSDYKYYSFTYNGSVSADRIKVRQANHCWMPAPGNHNSWLWVDKLVINGVNYESEAPTTRSVGKWYENRCDPEPGHYLESEELNCGNSYFDYAGSTVFPDTSDYRNYAWNVPSGGLGVSDGSEPQLYMPAPGRGNSACTSDAGGCEGSDVGIALTNITESGNDLIVDWKVWYFGNIGNDLDIYGWTSDFVGQASGWVDIGDWFLDLRAPEVSISISHNNLPGRPSDSIDFDESASDNDSFDTGLRRIYDRVYNVTNAGETRSGSIGPDVGAGAAGTWDPPPTVVTGFTGGDEVTGSTYAEDMVCNVSSATSNLMQAGAEWMQTKYGAVYAALGFDNPVISGQFMNSFVTTGVYDTDEDWFWNPADDILSQRSWATNPYNDMHRGLGWYEMLKRLARKSEWLRSHDILTPTVSGGRIDLDNMSEDGIYEYNGSDDVTVFSSSGQCSGRKILFVDAGNVAIEPDILLANDNSACLFVVRNDVNIAPGADAGNADNEDIIHAGIFADSFTSGPDNAFDKLRIRGLVIANDTNFNRDLVFEDNLLYPAELIVYDSRLLHLLRDMLGSRPYEQFKCGTVKDTPACEGWE